MICLKDLTFIRRCVIRKSLKTLSSVKKILDFPILDEEKRAGRLRGGSRLLEKKYNGSVYLKTHVSHSCKPL